MTVYIGTCSKSTMIPTLEDRVWKYWSPRSVVGERHGNDRIGIIASIVMAPALRLR